jgi:osmotically-inducible protein OsmY
MKGRLLAAVVLGLSLGAAACGGRDDNANNNNSGANRNTAANANANANLATPTPAASSSDNALKNTVEANLTKAGVTGVTVTVSNGEVTLKGSVPRAKLQDVIKAANDANPRRVDNQLNIQ